MPKITPFIIASLLALSIPAFAAGGGSGGTGGGGSGGASGSAGGGNDASPANKHCKKGEVWDKKTKACVKAHAGILPDEDLYQQGRALARQGYYDWAIEVLATVQNQEDPRVLNYTGYSHRKAGRLEIGITYYQKALAIDPNFNLAREYLGEGYIAAGRVDLAQNQLSAIEKSCGKTCEEYKDLSEAISTAN